MEPLDENLLKRLILQLEKRTLRNQEMRTKYADAPERFLDSEMELHEAIQALHAVATGPELYPRLVGLGAVSSLLALLGHENTDIAIAVIDLLQVRRRGRAQCGDGGGGRFRSCVCSGF